MTPQQRIERLYELARRAWPYAKDIAISHGLDGSDPHTIYIKVDGDVVFDIDCNEYVLDALEVALPVLARVPVGDKLLESLKQAHDEIQARGLRYEDIDLNLTLADNAKRLCVSPETIAAVLDLQRGEVPLWAVELASTWQLLAGQAPAKDLDAPSYTRPYSVPPSEGDKHLAAHFRERPDDLAAYFASLRWHIEQREKQLLRKHAQDILRAARRRK